MIKKQRDFLKSLRLAAENSANLKQLSKEVISLLRNYKNKNSESVGYVAGIITSDGPGKIDQNVNNLITLTNQIRKNNRYLIFSSTDIFNDKIVNQLEEHKLPSDKEEIKYQRFWKVILRSSLVTDVFMTKGWERSSGAQDEHNAAKEMEIKIHYTG